MGAFLNQLHLHEFHINYGGWFISCKTYTDRGKKSKDSHLEAIVKKKM